MIIVLLLFIGLFIFCFIPFFLSAADQVSKKGDEERIVINCKFTHTMTHLLSVGENIRGGTSCGSNQF